MTELYVWLGHRTVRIYSYNKSVMLIEVCDSEIPHDRESLFSLYYKLDYTTYGILEDLVVIY